MRPYRPEPTLDVDIRDIVRWHLTREREHVVVDYVADVVNEPLASLDCILIHVCVVWRP